MDKLINLMLLGEYRYSVDSKGRIAIPAKFREKIGTGAIITRGLDNCLFLFSHRDWEGLAQKLVALPLSQSGSRAFTRLMFAGAVAVEFDSQGRILIPDYLRRFAGIKRKVVIAGLYSRIEIWDEQRWEQYKGRTEEASDEIAEKLGELGI